MDTEKVYTTSLRLYKSRPVHHQAYRYLKEYNKDIFKTKDDFIAEAIVYFAKYLQQEEEVQRGPEQRRKVAQRTAQAGKLAEAGAGVVASALGGG